MDAENGIADAVVAAEQPGHEPAAEVGADLDAPQNAQQPVEGLEGDAYAADAAHIPASDELAAAAAQDVAAEGYQPTAEEYAAYYQQHADHYQQEAAPDEDADPHALTSLYTVEDGQQKQLTVADVNAMAQHPEGEWTPEDEQELLQLSNDEQYRALKMGAPWAHWSVHDNVFAGMAAFLKRTIRDVRHKVHEKLAAGEILAGKHGDAGAGEGGPPPEGAHGGDDGGAAAAADGVVDGAVAGLSQHGVAMLGHEHMSEGLPAEVVAQMGYHLDQLPALTAEQMQQMAAQVQSLTPEQVHAYQQQVGMLPLQQFQLAAGQVAYAAAAGNGDGAAAEGLPAAAAAASAAAYPGGLDTQAFLAQQLAAVQAAGPFPIPLPVAQHASLGVTTTNNPRNDRHFWKEAEQQELLRLVADQSYRQSVLGIAELSWDAIAKHLGRGKRSVQRKYDNLKGSLVHGPPGAAPLPSNDGKKWSAEEVAELLQLVEDEHYRRQRLGLEKVDWRAFGQHFGRSYESVSYKYSYIKNTGRTGQDGKAKHAKAKHETSYKEMAIYALQQLAVRTGVPEGNSGQICFEIAQNPVFKPQLDTAIVSGKKTLQRWKHGVRSALNAFAMFTKTGAVRDGEVVWRLDEASLQQEQAAQAAKANRARQKPLSGAQRRKMRRATGESGPEGEEAGDEAGEEAAHEALTAMLAGQRPPSARLAARKRPGQADSDYDDDEERERPRKKGKTLKRESAPAVNGHALPTSMPGLAIGAGGQIMMAPEAMFAVLPLMMQPGGGGDAPALAAFAAAGQQAAPDFMSALTPEQREALEKQQRAAEAAGLLRPAGGPDPSPAAEAPPPAPAAAAAAAAAQPAAAEAPTPGPGQLQPWLAQMAWPPGAGGGGDVAQAQAAVAAAFMAAAAPAAAAAEAAAEGVPAPAEGAPAAAAAMDAAAIFAAAEAEAARLAAAQLAVGAGGTEGGGGAAASGVQEVAAPAAAGGSGEGALPDVGSARQAPGPELASGAGAAEATDAAVPACEAAAEGGAVGAAGEAVGGADLQMEQLHAYLAHTDGHVEGGGGGGQSGVDPQLGASLDPASMAHYASLDADQQAAYLAQHSYPADGQQYHYAAEGAAAQLPFDAAAMFAAQGQATDVPQYDQHAGQYVGQDAGQYDAAQYQHAAQHGTAEHVEQYQHAAYYEQHGSAAAPHEVPPDGQHYAPADAHQHYAAADAQQYAGDHGQYVADAQHYAADAQQHYAAEGQQQYAAEHGQYAEHGQAYSAEQQAAYAAEHGQAYAPEGFADGQAYSAEHGQAYSAEHGQAYSAEHGQAYSAEHGQAYSAEHGQAYSAEHGQAYSAEHGQAYSAEHGAAVYPEGYAAADPAAAHYGSEHGEGYDQQAYAAYHGDHADPAAAAYQHHSQEGGAEPVPTAVAGYGPHDHQPHHGGDPQAYAAAQPQQDYGGEGEALAAVADAAADAAVAAGHAAAPGPDEAGDLVAGMFADTPHAQEVTAK